MRPMESRKLPVGPELDAAICREVFGLSQERVDRLTARGRLPRYSQDYGQAAKVHEHFWRLACSGQRREAVARYATVLGEMTSHPVHGILSVILIGSCPSNICDAALFAVRDRTANQGHDPLVEQRAAAAD